jgi:putative NIF3 family GTP cyclohydrolase 1 type 2
VVHEPTFYTHWDLEAKQGDYLDAPEPARTRYMELRDRKKEWILENGMVVIRCHDVLDAVAGFGVPFALGRFLGFRDEDRIQEQPYYHVYEMTSRPAARAAAEIARRLKSLGQPGVAFYGDDSRPVSRVGLGTGCICDPMQFMHMEADLYIAIDDMVRTWIQTIYAEDSGLPLVVVHHGTSEEPGVQLLSQHLQQAFPSHEVIHFQQGCGYQWITT